MKSTKYNKIKANTKLEIHPFARNAYECSRAIKHKFNVNMIEEYSWLRTQIELKAIRHSNSHLRIISGFENPFFDLNEIKLSDYQIQYFEAPLSQTQIEEIAWKPILLNLLNSIDQTSFSDLMVLLNTRAPAHVMNSTFAESKFTTSRFAQFSNTDRSTLNKQKNKKRRKPLPRPTIASQIFLGMKQK